MLIGKEDGSNVNVVPPGITGFGHRKKLYISGPITNHPNYLTEFKAVEDRLRSMGFQPINPAKFISLLPIDMEYERTMHICYALIDVSDGIFMMQGWMKSRGAKLELEYALKHNKPDYYEEFDL